MTRSNDPNSIDKPTQILDRDAINGSTSDAKRAKLQKEAASLTPEEHRARMEELAKRIAKERYQQQRTGAEPATPAEPARHAAKATPSKSAEIPAYDKPIHSIDDFLEQEYMGGGSRESKTSEASSRHAADKPKRRKKRKSDTGKRSTTDGSKKLNPTEIKDKAIYYGKKLIPSKFDKNGNPLSKKRYIFKCGRRAVAYLVGLTCIYMALCIITAPSIDPKNIYDQISTSSVIYDDSGNEIEEVNTGEKREIIKYDQMPEDLSDAFVALEDKTFWKHHGFNWKRMVGAVLSSLKGGGGISGTSTITQQLARNVYLPDIKSERSIRRKIVEMWYSARIEHSLSKEDILAAYVNSIYFGNGNYGVQAAARNYFSKDVEDLTLEESAALAAMPQSPDTYALIKPGDAETNEYTTAIQIDGSDYLCNDISKDRRDTCLDLMKAQGYITDEEYAANYDQDLIDFINPSVERVDESYSSYFSDYMIDEVIADLMDEYSLSYETASQMVYGGGLKIYSTMDSTAQHVMDEAFDNPSNFPSLWNLQKDDDGNIVTEAGAITLYSYDNLINDNGDFTLKKGEFTSNDDGSLTIKSGKRLNIYTTEVAEGTDYSIEFKPSYNIVDGSFYIYNTGYINVPREDKTLDDDGNVTISAEWIKNNSDKIDVNGSTCTVKSAGFTMADGVIQPQGAMVITEVGTGEIKAMIGGRGIEGRALYNRAINPRQPGSSIKPLAVYSAALQKSYEAEQNGEKFPFIDPGNDKQGSNYGGDYFTAGSTIVDEPIYFDGKAWPSNSYGGYQGSITTRRAMQLSSNVCAVKIFEQVGVEYSSKNVKKFGITTLVTDENEGVNDLNAAALALGGLTQGVTPLEMAQAYATFPNGGVRNSSIAYTKVVDRKGKVILQSESEETEVLNEGVAFILTDMMKSVVTKGTGTPAALSGVQAGGKTGTTSNEYDIWFDGFTPSYAASIWIGTDVNIQLTSSSSGAAALWGRIMNNIPRAKEGSYKEAPDNVVVYRNEYYTKGTSPGEGVSAKSYNGSVTGNSSTSSGTSKKKSTKKKSNNDTKKNDNNGSSDNGGNGNSGNGSSGNGGSSDSGSGSGNGGSSGGSSDSGSSGTSGGGNTSGGGQTSGGDSSGSGSSSGGGESSGGGSTGGDAGTSTQTQDNAA